MTDLQTVPLQTSQAPARCATAFRLSERLRQFFAKRRRDPDDEFVLRDIQMVLGEMQIHYSTCSDCRTWLSWMSGPGE